MKHSLNISLSKSQKGNNVLRYKNVLIREKLLTLILGRLQGVTIIVPGNTVDKIAISENTGGD